MTAPPDGPARRGHRPPWWPEGEPWPPRRPPWGAAPARFRRRFLLVAAGVLAGLMGTGMVLGALFGGGGPPWSDHPRGGGPGGPLVGLAFVAVVGGGATLLAYRRISRPVGDLLGAAERLTRGDYDAQVEPGGPRELRTLARTFNEMAARLAATEEQRRRFLADVTHELRTPLAVLQSRIEAQLDGIHPRDDRHLGSLLEETQVLGRLVDDLHTLALADAGRLVLHRERTHPATLVEDAVESQAALAARAGVAISVAAPASLPEVDVDPTRIRQVLANLLTNAVRHAPAGSTVTVTVTVAAAARDGDGDGGVAFSVADQGPGIPAGQLALLFERFTRSADSRGSGLGLSIARDLVAAHGGTIRAENGPAGGAVIAFTVPAGAG